MGRMSPPWSTYGKTMDAIRDTVEFCPRDSIHKACLAMDPASGRVGIAVTMRDGQVHAVMGDTEQEALEGLAGRLDYLELAKRGEITVKPEVEHG
jgi:hypothetical protein